MKYDQLTMAFAPSYTLFHTHSKAISEKMLTKYFLNFNLANQVPTDDSGYWILPPDVEADFNS